MNLIENAEKECAVLGSLFQGIVNEMKNSSTLWEDFASKANKMHLQLKSTLTTFGLFLDAFQRIADLATNTKGATREIGTGLTRLILRHKSIEQKLKCFTNAFVETLIQPLNERVEEWKKSTHTLDKDHAKGLKDYKKLRNELRKKASETSKLQKKCRQLPKHDILHNKLNSAIQEVSNYYDMLQEREKQAVRSAMIEERSRFCTLVTLLKPVLDLEISMATEMSHIDDLVQYLSKHTADPQILPVASEQVIKDIKGIDYSTIVAFKTPPSSPGSLSSRKSSVCSINSISSSSSSSTNPSRSPSNNGQVPSSSSSTSHPNYPPPLPIPIQHQFRHTNNNRSLSMPANVAVSRLSSVSSQDSGFTSQEQFFARPPSPLAEAEREVDGSASPLLVVCSTLNAWAKRPDLPSNGKHSATVTGASEPGKNCRPAITAHTFDPPSPSLFEKPNWQIYEDTNYQQTSSNRITSTISDDGSYGALPRQHSIPSRRCRMRDLSLERHPPMREQLYQSTINYSAYGRAKPTLPPQVPADYYGSISNRFSSEDINQQVRRASDTSSSDCRNIVWRDRNRQNGHTSTSHYGSYYGRPSLESADETLDEMYEYLTKSVQSTNFQQKMNPNDTIRRGMSLSSHSQEKPPPPIRRTPSINTNAVQQQQHQQQNNHVELQSRLKARLKRAEEIAGQTEFVQAQKLAQVKANQNGNASRTNGEEEFPPPPPDFLLNNEPQGKAVVTATSSTTDNSSLLAEIQRGGFKLRRTVIDRDRSAPRLK